MMAASRSLRILVALAALTPAFSMIKSTVDQGDGVEKVSTGGSTEDTKNSVIGSGLQNVFEQKLWGSDSTTASGTASVATLESDGCRSDEDAETCRKRKAAEAELAEKPSSEEDEPEPTWPFVKGQLVERVKGGAVGTVVALPDPEKPAGHQRFTVSFKGSLNTDKKYRADELRPYSGKYHPDVGDVVIQTKKRGMFGGEVGSFAKVVSFAKIDSQGREWVNIEYSNRRQAKLAPAEVRKAVGDEPGRFEAAYAERRDPPLDGAPVHPNAGAVSDAEVEQLGKKAYEDLGTSKFNFAGWSKIFEGDKIILPTAYDIDALRQVIPPLDQALVKADSSGTRDRRKDTHVAALKQLPDADVVKIAKELLEEFDKLSSELKNGGLKSERAGIRERTAKGLADEALSQAEIDKEEQVAVDYYYFVGGHDEAGYVYHGTKVPRERHAGNSKSNSFTPARCLKGRPSYDKPLCDAITAALEAKYPGGLEAAFTDFTKILFSQDSVRLYSERGYFECIRTGEADGARQCRAGTRGRAQAEEWFQLSIRAANSLWKDELGLKSFDPDPTDDELLALDRKIAALIVPLIEGGLVRLHPTAGKKGGPTLVTAGPVWGELENWRLQQNSVLKWTQRQPLRLSELAVAIISLGGQEGYPFPATMNCKYGAQVLARLKYKDFDLEAEVDESRKEFEAFLAAQLEKCRLGEGCPRMFGVWRSQHADLTKRDDEYFPRHGIYDFGVLPQEIFTHPTTVLNGAWPPLYDFLEAVAELAPGRSEVTTAMVRDFLSSRKGTKNTWRAGELTICIAGEDACRYDPTKWYRHYEPFPLELATKPVVVAMELTGPAEDE